MKAKIHYHRLLLMIPAMLALVLATWGGLVRLGWGLPLPQPTLMVSHGPLLVSGFLGTLIGLERAVALRQRWAYGAPLLNAIGAVLVFAGVPGWPGPLLMTLGSLGVVLIFGVVIRRQAALFTWVMALGALVWFIANVRWLLGLPLYDIAYWWAGFLVLTIAGERLELSRLLQLPRHSKITFLASLGLFLIGLAWSHFHFPSGVRVIGLGLIALTLWLLRHDIARRTVHQTGLTRFIAICLLSAYVWLGVSGILALAYGGVVGGPVYDAILHAIFLGFVFSMIFGHAPIIFPAVLGLPVTFRNAFYAHLLLLHISLIMRVVGNLTDWGPGREWGGMLNAATILLFLVNTIVSTRDTTVQRTATNAPVKAPEKAC